MKRLTLILVALALLSGCAGTQQYLPLIDAGLLGGEGITQAGHNLAIRDKNVAGCYVTSSLMTALATSKSAVDGWMTPPGPGVIPAVSINITDCVALSGEPLKPVVEGDAAQLVQDLVGGILPAVDAIIRVVLNGSEATCEDKAIADAVLRYLQLVAPTVVDELVHPDGKLDIAEVTLHTCPEPEPAAQP